MNNEWIIVKNTPCKNNPLLAIPEKIAVLDECYEAYENLMNELKETGKKAYKFNSYSQYFNTDKLPREFYKNYNENIKEY